MTRSKIRRHAAASSASTPKPCRLSRAFAKLSLASFLLCGGWGATGHKVVARIAYDHLTPATKSHIDDLLGNSTLPEFSVWPDQIKRDPAWRWTRPWHFADMAEDETRFSLERDCPDDGCVVRGIKRYQAELRDPATPREEQVRALKFLTHYVGDVHQPLHVGLKADKGGNDIQVRLFKRRTNLHSVWDDGMIKSRGMDDEAYARRLERSITDEIQAADLQAMDPCDWATESHTIAMEHAYRDAAGERIASGAQLGEDYIRANTLLIDDQLTRAGLRLARMLNDIYDAGAPMPPVVPPETPSTTHPATDVSPAPAPAPAAPTKPTSPDSH